MNNGIEKLQELADQIEREHVQELQALEAELDKRLMPPGMEWPRFEDGVFVLPSDKGIIGIEYSKTGNIVIVTANDDEPRMVYAKGERVKRPATEVLGADGKPIEAAHTQPDTQERIDDDATMPPRRYYAEKIGHDVDLKDDEEVFTAVALSLMSRQRELDARTIGGE